MYVSKTRPRKELKHQIISFRIGDATLDRLEGFSTGGKLLSAGQAVRQILEDFINGSLVRARTVSHGRPNEDANEKISASAQG
jgi:hypothetical protein